MSTVYYIVDNHLSYGCLKACRVRDDQRTIRDTSLVTMTARPEGLINIATQSSPAIRHRGNRRVDINVALAPESDGVTVRHSTDTHLAYWRNRQTYEAPTGERILLNISGRRFMTLSSTLASRPGTLLASLAAKHAQLKQEEYFFDRHFKSFYSILDYYRSGL